MQREGKLQQYSVDFSIKLIELHERISGKSFLKNQLARSGTSIGANIHESGYAESPEDFIHKLSVALKECNETEYWLTLLASACPQLAAEAVSLKRDAGSLRRMLIASITTVKQRYNVQKH
ncbi:MAG: four helix bundle protein [Akkermansia sp.]|nr:four helix bundle protein [Akkermansia sp.]